MSPGNVHIIAIKTACNFQAINPFRRSRSVSVIKSCNAVQQPEWGEENWKIYAQHETALLFPTLLHLSICISLLCILVIFFYAAACYPTESFWFRLNYILHVPIPPNRFSVCVRTGKVAPQNSQQTQMSWSDHVSADHRGHKYSLNGITSVKTNETSNAFAYILRQQFSFMCNTI